MNGIRESTFIVVRDDRSVDPKTIVSDGLRIGRLPDSDVWLNHSAVSRLHAGISRVEQFFYLINLSASSAITLNGRAIPFNESDALTRGDIVRIGPFFLEVEEAENILKLRVSLQFALNVAEGDSPHLARATNPLELPRRSVIASTEALTLLRIFWEKRTRDKAGRPSPLHPQAPPRLGKIRFNWSPTRDLVRPWPLAILIWTPVVIGLLSVVGAFAYKSAFAPQPLSTPHTRAHVSLSPAIAKTSSAGKCASCHAIGVSLANRNDMNARCADCHETDNFAPTVITAHREAGITCSSCHTEHRGKDFSPLNAALESCSKCHNDSNTNSYNGRSVHTAHGGTYGYPVSNGVWIWKGLDAEELATRPAIVALLDKNRVTPQQPQQWRNAQFHALHIQGVRVINGINGTNEAGTVAPILSCSSCHKNGYMGANVDRNSPRTTCAGCHNSRTFDQTKGVPLSDGPSCTSCHVQHVRDTRWASQTLLSQADSDAHPNNQE